MVRSQAGVVENRGHPDTALVVQVGTNGEFADLVPQYDPRQNPQRARSCTANRIRWLEPVRV